MKKVLRVLLFIFSLIFFFICGFTLGVPELSLTDRMKLFFSLFSLVILLLSISLRIALWSLSNSEGIKYRLRRGFIGLKTLLKTFFKLLILIIFLAITIFCYYALIKTYVKQGHLVSVLYVFLLGTIPFLLFLTQKCLRKWNQIIIFKWLHFAFGVINVLFFNFLFPMILVVGYIGFLLFISGGVLFIVLMELRYYSVLNLNLHGIYFICFVLGTISLVHLSDVMKRVINSILPINLLIEGMSERFKKFVSYLLRKECLDALMFMGYAIFLLITTFSQLNSGTYIISNKADNAVVQSFLVYIAFTNMKGKFEFVKFDIDVLFDRFISVTIKNNSK